MIYLHTLLKLVLVNDTYFHLSRNWFLELKIRILERKCKKGGKKREKYLKLEHFTFDVLAPFLKESLLH